MFFLPGNIAAWASVFFFISEFPWVIGGQIIVIVSDAGSISYATFGIPLLYLTPWLYFFAAWTFIGFENLFEKSNRDRLGRRKG